MLDGATVGEKVVLDGAAEGEKVVAEEGTAFGDVDGLDDVGDPTTFLTTELPVSAMYIMPDDESNTILRGDNSVAVTAGPPSPVYPLEEPATLVMIPVLLIIMRMTRFRVSAM